MKAFGEKFGGSVYYDAECSAHTKRGKTVYGYGVQFLADLKFGLISAFAVFPAGDGFRPEIADWVIETKQIFGWGPIQLTSDREYTIAKAIHKWHEEQIFHYGIADTPITENEHLDRLVGGEPQLDARLNLVVQQAIMAKKMRVSCLARCAV